MWLLTTFLAALTATAFAYVFKNKYKLGLLCLMLWGGTIMILIDHLLGYKGGAFLETETNGFIPNSTLLGLAMLVPVLLVWVIAVYMQRSNKCSDSTGVR